MTRRHGKGAKLLVSATSGGTAIPVDGIQSFSFDAAVDFADVTAFGDTNKQWVPGLADASGAFSGVFSPEGQALIAAAADGLDRKHYFYPDFTNTPTMYQYGNIFIDYSGEFSNDKAETVACKWKASGTIGRTANFT